MNYYGDNIEYAMARLNNTIVNCSNGFPVYVRSVESKAVVYVRKLINNDDVIVQLSDLDLSPVKLGWVNQGTKGIAYLQRIPARQWSQGLSKNSLHYVYSNCGPISFPSKYLHHTIVGHYPTFNQALESVAKSGGGRAFSRSWAIEEHGLLYNGKCVGYCDKNKLALLKRYAYLTEFLQETTGVGCEYL